MDNKAAKNPGKSPPYQLLSITEQKKRVAVCFMIAPMFRVMITAITTDIVATRQLESSRVRVRIRSEFDILHYSLDFPVSQRHRPSQQTSFSKPIWTFGGLGAAHSSILSAVYVSNGSVLK